MTNNTKQVDVMQSEFMADRIRRDRNRLTKYKKVFGTSEGQWVLKDLIFVGDLLTPLNTDNPTQLAILAGKREVIISILALLGLSLEQLVASYTADPDNL